jgi:capsular exopolysaccharide synthesis family protein
LADHDQTETAGWLVPEAEQQGLRRNLETLRERFRLIAVTTLVCTLAAALYVAVADKTYKATANLLVTPVSRDNDTLIGAPVIRDSSDPTRDVETAAQLVTTTDVARLVQQSLGTSEDPRALLKKVKADPVAQSNVVEITSEAKSGFEAQRLANAFGDAVVLDRTRKLHAWANSVIRGLRPRVRALPPPQPGAAPDPLSSKLSELEALRNGQDPTIQLDTRADAPDSPAWPKPTLSIIGGFFAGLVLGIGAAFAAQMLDPRMRREEQLRRLYRLPVLARIPQEDKPLVDGAIAPHQLSPAGVEAYRTLRATLAASRGGEGKSRSIMITGASPSEGKTTTAVNLAASLALSGKRVILIEADLRKPKVGQALGVNPTRGIASVLIDNIPLRGALVTSEAYGENLQLLLVDEAGEWMADQFSLLAARTLVEEAKEMADFVIIDSPPLTAVIDALPLVQMADDLLIVVRLGKTHINKLTRLGELLAQQGIRPVGFALVGVNRTNEYGYYHAGERSGPTSLLRHAEDRERAPALRAS